MAVATLDQLEKVITDLLSESFTTVKIISVEVAEDVDFDGDNILSVKVVFDGEATQLQGNMIAKAIRKVRPALEEMEWSAFPSLSFMSQEDAKIAACS